MDGGRDRKKALNDPGLRPENDRSAGIDLKVDRLEGGVALYDSQLR